MMTERFILLCSLVGVLCLETSHGENSIIVTRTPSTVPVIGSTTKYTITCDVTVSCTGLCNDTLTISWSLNGDSINSASLTEFNNSPFAVSSGSTFTSTVTTVGDIRLSHAGQYQCTASLTDGIGHSNTTHFDVKSTLVCSASIINISGILFFNQWTGPDTLVLSEGIDPTLVMQNVDVDDAGQYMCIITASYTGSEVNTTYVMDSMNTVQTPTVEVTNTTVSSGEDATLTCIVATVNNNLEDITSNIIWSPNTGTAGATLRTNNIFISIYTISNVDDDGIYTCNATLSHTSEYVLRSDSESGDGSVSVTEATKTDENAVIVLAVILSIVLLALIIIITVFICFLMRVRSSKHGIHVPTDDNELSFQELRKIHSENEEIGKDVEITDKDPIDVTPLLPGSPLPEDIPVQ